MIYQSFCHQKALVEELYHLELRSWEPNSDKTNQPFRAGIGRVLLKAFFSRLKSPSWWVHDQMVVYVKTLWWLWGWDALHKSCFSTEINLLVLNSIGYNFSLVIRSCSWMCVWWDSPCGRIQRIWGTCWDLHQQPVGDSVWWLLGNNWCPSGLLSTWNNLLLR